MGSLMESTLFDIIFITCTYTAVGFLAVAMEQRRRQFWIIPKTENSQHILWGHWPLQC